MNNINLISLNQQDKIPPKSPMRSPKPLSNKNKNSLSGTIGAKRALKKFKNTGNKDPDEKKVINFKIKGRVGSK